MREVAKQFGVVTKQGRVIRQDILEQYASKAQSKQADPDSFTGNYGKNGLVQPLYNPEALTRILEINTYHYRACRTKARDTAGLGWTLRPLNDNASMDSEMYKLLDGFLSGLPESVGQVWDKAMFDFESIGYGAVEVVRENDDPHGPIALMAHIPGHTLRIHQDGNRFQQKRGRKTRWFKNVEFDGDVDINTGEIKPIGSLDPSKRASEVLWFTNYTPRSDYYGLPDVMPALGAIHGDMARRDYNIAFFDNFGVPAYAVFVTGNFDPGEVNEDGRTEMEAAIEGHFAEMAKNPHSTLILTVPTRDRSGEVNIEFKPLSIEVKEASFRLYRQDNRDEILAAHGVPPYRMGIAETGSLGGSTAQESTEIYKSSIINPRQEIIETLINRYIIWGAYEANDWQFKFLEIDTSDEAHDLVIVTGLFSLGAVTPNQIIRHFGERFGLEESDHPAMDAHYVANVAIDLAAGDDIGGAEAVMLSLQSRLLEVAEKHVGLKASGGSRDLVDVIAGLQKREVSPG